MPDKRVEDFKLQISDYAAVNENATLSEAIQALLKALEDFDQGRFPHPGIVVLDEHGAVVGRLGQQDILRDLESKYEVIEPGRFG